MQISHALRPSATAAAAAADTAPHALQQQSLSWLSPGLTPPHLELVFSLARIPWVRDFLLRPDTRGDIATLCGPLQVAHAWGAQARVHVRASPPLRALALDFDLALNLAFVPALSCGTLTVGVAVQERAGGSSGSGAGGNERVSVGRFVRDDANGAVFVLAARGGSGENSGGSGGSGSNHVARCFEVLFVYHESAMRTSRYYLRFQADRFRNAMARRGEAFQVAEVSAALIYCTLQSEVRDCPMCRSPMQVLCGCNLAFIPPKHSVDFAPLRANMQAMMGRFEGTGVGELRVGGDSLRAHSSSKVQVVPSGDVNLLQRLAMLGTQTLVLAASQVVTSPLTSMDYIAPEDAAVKEINYVQSLESIIHESLAPSLEAHTPPPPTSLMTSFMCTGAQQPLPHLSPVSEVTGTRSETGERKWIGNGVGSVEVAYSPTSSQESSASERTRGPRRGSRRPVSEEVLREREARKQVRIFKNRAAAARSNARRKLQNDALKGALAEVRGRALQLRDRHMALREENLRLKMALLM